MCYAPKGPYVGLMAPKGWNGRQETTRLLAWGRKYPTRRELRCAAAQAERRTGWVLVAIRDSGEVPGVGDAQGWDDYRQARGYVGGHS